MEPRDDLERGLREMLDDIPPHDDRARRATLEALPTTPQRRNRWLPVLGRGLPGRPPAAYVGVAAASLILVAGVGMVLSSLGEPPPQAGVATPDLRPPERFEGAISCGPVRVAPTTTGTDVALGDSRARIWQDRGAAYTLRIVSIDDARLMGTLTNQLDVDRYGAGPEALEVGSLTWSIENDEGAWTTHFTSFLTEPGEWATAATHWDGSGDYEGLAALMQIDYIPATAGGDCGWEVQGLIVPADRLPAYPELEPDLFLRPDKTDDPAGT